jgi:tRNA(Ile)-lysidine synthase
LRQLRSAKSSNNIQLQWKSAEFRSYREDLYLLPPQIVPATPSSRIWQPHGPLDLPEVGLRVTPFQGLGTGIRWVGKNLPDLEIFWHVDKGIRPAFGARTRSLRNLFQENGIPPWERRRIPIICIAGSTACLPGIAIAVEFAAGSKENGVDFCLEKLP